MWSFLKWEKLFSILFLYFSSHDMSSLFDWSWTENWIYFRFTWCNVMWICRLKCGQSQEIVVSWLIILFSSKSVTIVSILVWMTVSRSKHSSLWTSYQVLFDTISVNTPICWFNTPILIVQLILLFDLVNWHPAGVIFSAFVTLSQVTGLVT